MAQSLLDFSQPLDVALLDRTVAEFYGAASAEQRAGAEEVLKALQANQDAWQKVDSILEASNNQQTKFFALQILEDVIKFRWGALPDEQREGIKTYISNLIIKICTDVSVFRAERVFLRKMNVILVQILKQDWPHKWRSFIPDIVGASRTSETLCENCMEILMLLSEEVFDFSRGELTLSKTKELKMSLNADFRLIHDLCLYVLNAGARADLTRATLKALHAFLSWIPLGYIFESQLVDALLKLFPQPAYRNTALQCLTEVASLTVGPEYDHHFNSLYRYFITQLQTVLPPQTDIVEAYAAGSDEEQAFVQDLAIFFTSFFRAHITILETTPDGQQALLLGLQYLTNISFVNDEEVFKITLEYWNFFVPDIYSSSSTLDTTAAFAFGGATEPPNRKAMYLEVLSRLRLLMISRMAKPEEVIVVEDENGNIVRETMKDTDTLARYKTMHETLVYLAHLDHQDTERQMLELLNVQMNGKDFAWNSLNTLCWAIGSISGAMSEEQENRFLVMVVKDLLTLVEMTRGKNNKAVIAANIMYVVGQYPRFLRNHWKFLKTVVNKLFEFMHETHPGVQDMACETFLKICSKCTRKFVVQQIGETEPFISELLTGLTNIIQDLETHQIHMFYEAVALMTCAEASATKREEYLTRLMQPPNATWQQIISQAVQSAEVLKTPDVVRNVQNILQTNCSVASSLGSPFLSQMSIIYVDMLNVYRMYSELISSSIATGGPHAAKTSAVKMMRSVKKVTLRLIQTFVEKADDHAVLIAEQFVPAMLDPILGDYARNVPDARDAEVLSLFATIISKLQGAMEDKVPVIFEAVFEVTLTMITKNFEDYPEHRLQFFNLLHAITKHCFSTLFTMTSNQLKLVIDSIVWAFRHTERNIADTGLSLLLDICESYEGSDAATEFYQAYLLQLLQEVFAVMTDTFHKPGFKMHARILHHLFGIAGTDVIKAPLWNPATQTATSNAAFVHEYVTSLLTSSFPNMRPQQVQACVAGMFDYKDFAVFKQHLRDFLVQTKQFADANNAELFAEEVAQQQEAERQRLAAIPGMVKQEAGNIDDMT